MSITIQWDDANKSLFRWDINGAHSSDQLAQAFTTSAIFIRGVAHVVHGLLVLNQQPGQQPTLSRDDLPSVNWPANLAQIVVVGATPKEARLLSRRLGVRVTFAPDLAHAYHLLAQRHAHA